MKRLRLLLPLLMILFSLLLEVASAKRGGTWTETSPMTVVRQFQTATLLRDDNVLVAAGYGDGGRLASAELYDPARHAWTATGSLNAGRGFHTAALLLDGQVLVAGGFNSNHDSFGIASAELYDPARHTWTLVDPMNNARVHHTATLLPTGQVLVAGGNNYFPIASTELYDPIHHTWTFATSMNVIRTNHAADAGLRLRQNRQNTEDDNE